MRWFDSHAHVDSRQFSDDREEVIRRTFDSGVTRFINIGCDRRSCISTVNLVKKHEGIYGTIGLHPHNAKTMTEELLGEMKRWAGQAKIVAIGETGLDFHYDFSPRDVQRQVFRQQIRLASELGLPLVIHDREAHQECLDILTEEDGWKNGGVFHCYSGSAEMAKEIVKNGFYISFAGPVTFPNAIKLRQAAAAVPLDKMLIETDCPYLTPQAYRGKRNEPAYVAETGKFLAEMKGISQTEMAEILWNNTCSVFRIPV